MKSRFLQTAFVVLLSIPGIAQEEADAPPAMQEPSSAPAPAPSGLEFAVHYDYWSTDGDFRSRTIAEIVEYESDGIAGINLEARLALDTSWSVKMGLAPAIDEDIRMTVFSGGAVLQTGLLDDPWNLAVSASVLYGTLDLAGVHGDFDPAFGFEAGIDASYGVADGLSIQVSLLIRQLEFDFDPEFDVTGSDDDFGGFGGRILLGFEYRL